MRLLGRNTPSKTPVEHVAELLATLNSGRLPCPVCRKAADLKDLESLQMTECHRCGEISFVPLRIEEYWLVKPIGGGGMGSVYKAYHPEDPEHTFAVKILARSDRDRPSRAHALLTEARTARALGGHPCLVRHTASGFAGNECFFAMDFVEGESLDRRIDHVGRLPEHEVLLMALYVLAAEQHIYRRGYLYCDLKPQNILLSPRGGAVLLDYGLCTPRDRAEDPEADFVAGSPYYVPPERLQGKREDACSEIYSLGMVMYHALSGQTFFDADEVESLAQKHLADVRVAVSSKLRRFHPGIVSVLTGMLRQEPEERYQSFPDVARALYALHQELRPERSSGT